MINECKWHEFFRGTVISKLYEEVKEMNFEYTEEQKQIIQLIKEFSEKEVDHEDMAERAEKAAAAKTIEELRALKPVELLKKLHDVGLRQLAVPERYGGGGHTDWLTLTIATEKAGYYGGFLDRQLSIPWKYCSDISVMATPKQQDWFYERFMAKPDMFLAGSISEPEGMSDILMPYDEPGVAMKTTAVKDGNEWVINGNKMFCSGGGVADYILAGVRTDKNAPISKGFSRMWVKADSPGMSMAMNRLTMADVSGNVQISYDNVRVPEEQVVGEINKAYPMLDIRLANKSIHFAGQLGKSQKVVEDLVEYAKQRVAGGKPIIQHPNVAAQIGEAITIVEQARAFFYRAAWECDKAEKESGPLAVNPYWGKMCFVITKRMMLRICEIGTEIYGGIAGSIDMPFNKYVRTTYLINPGGGSRMLNEMKVAKHYFNLNL
jgi:alkylation response protein AidB-like acyl-CoA dehydrogenase